ncbi:MAG: hypothetical protein R2795_13395 [Saprospiraceae bacterium]
MLSWIAKGLSVVFHPLLLPTYMLFILMVVNPYLFGVNSYQEPTAHMQLLLVFLYTFFMPATIVLVMYFLGFIRSFQMKDKEERIGPYLITGMLYLWVYYNFSKTGQMPPAYVSFMLGAVIALFVAFLINIFTKISAHAVGMGGLLGMVVITMLWFSYGSFALPGTDMLDINVLYLLMATLLVAGAVGTARLYLKAHEPSDLVGGYFIGFVTQFLAFAFVF